MAMTDYTIDDTMVGAALPITNGYLVSLTLQTPPPVYATPSGDDGRGVWRAGYIQLKGSKDHRDLFCYNPAQGGHVSKSLIANNSLPYRGDLVVLACPKGRTFSLTLSDTPNVRSPSL